MKVMCLQFGIYMGDSKLKNGQSKIAIIFVVCSYIISIILWSVLFYISQNTNRFESIREDIVFTCQMYVLVIGLISLFLGKQLINKICLPLLFILFITDAIVSKVYYNWFLAPFAGVFDKYDTNLGVFKILPITLILYLILRKIFILLTGEEPKIVGKYAFFDGTGNYLFTLLVVLGGIVLSFLVPWH